MRFAYRWGFIIALIVLILLVFPLSQVAEAAKVSNGSMVGGILLEGLTYDEAEEKLATEVAYWNKEADIVIDFEHGTFNISREMFQFDLDASLDELKKQTKQPWYLFFLKARSAQLPLVVHLDEQLSETLDVPSYIDLEATLAQAKVVASYLGNSEIKAIFKEGTVFVNEEVANVEVIIPENYFGLERIVSQLHSEKIAEMSRYSYLESVIAPLEVSPSGKEMNFVASALYALLLKSNVEILERHSQGVIPSYLEPGIEVKVSQLENEDFIVYNPNRYAYTIGAEIRGNRLVLTLYAPEREGVYEYRIENKIEMEPRTIYRFSNELRPREKRTIQLGEQGVRVEVFRLHYAEEGALQEKLFISKEFYPPTPKVILVSTKAPPIDNETGHELDETNVDRSEETETSDDGGREDDEIKGYEIVDLEDEIEE